MQVWLRNKMSELFDKQVNIQKEKLQKETKNNACAHRNVIEAV